MKLERSTHAWQAEFIHGKRRGPRRGGILGRERPENLGAQPSVDRGVEESGTVLGWGGSKGPAVVADNHRPRRLDIDSAREWLL